MTKGKVYWIQKAGVKKGALSRQLDIPIEKNIPKTLINKIVSAKIGDTIINPTELGKRRIHVTRLIHKRSVLAKTLKGLKK